MPCYSPLLAGYARGVNPTGKKSLCFSPKNFDRELAAFQVPCGNCIGCRLETSKQWAIRATHEAKMHKYNCFITLTYAPEHLKSPSLIPDDFVKFMKKLRLLYGKGIGVFGAGEYGGDEKKYPDILKRPIGRPHFHACLFGMDFQDKIPYKLNKRGDILYTSKILDKLWNNNNPNTCPSIIGEVTFESAAYVARYVTKKIKGELSLEHYHGPLTNYQKLIPEYSIISRHNVIGKKWLEKYYLDIFNYGKLFIDNGKGDIIQSSIPRYYKKWLEKHYPDLRLKNKLNTWGFNETPEYKLDNTKERLTVKRKVLLSKINQLNRSLDQQEIKI